jgi:hypothetical protein
MICGPILVQESKRAQGELGLFWDEGKRQSITPVGAALLM